MDIIMVSSLGEGQGRYRTGLVMTVQVECVYATKLSEEVEKGLQVVIVGLRRIGCSLDSAWPGTQGRASLGRKLWSLPMIAFFPLRLVKDAIGAVDDNYVVSSYSLAGSLNKWKVMIDAEQQSEGPRLYEERIESRELYRPVYLFLFNGYIVLMQYIHMNGVKKKLWRLQMPRCDMPCLFQHDHPEGRKTQVFFSVLTHSLLLLHALFPLTSSSLEGVRRPDWNHRETAGMLQLSRTLQRGDGCREFVASETHREDVLYANCKLDSYTHEQVPILSFTAVLVLMIDQEALMPCSPCFPCQDGPAGAPGRELAAVVDANCFGQLPNILLQPAVSQSGGPGTQVTSPEFVRARSAQLPAQ
nr:hypothetical protein B23L21.30 [imported] - Neurospora crassa [Neurospora crassa]